MTDKQALREAAMKICAQAWEAEDSRGWSMSNGTADSLVLEVFGDETSGQEDCDIASFIAEASPANVLALLDELEESQGRESNESSCADSAINLAINWQIRCKEAESKLEAAERQIAKDVEIKARLCRESNSLFDRLRAAEKRIADQRGIILSARQFISEYVVSGDAGADEFVKVIDRAAGIGKGE